MSVGGVKKQKNLLTSIGQSAIVGFLRDQWALGGESAEKRALRHKRY